MQEIREEIVKIRDSQVRTEIAIAAIKVDVAHHIKRSDANESSIEKLKWWIIGLLTSILLAIGIKLLTG